MEKRIMNEEITHQIAVALRAMDRLSQWVKPGSANIFIKINDIEQEIHELRKLFEQIIPKE